MMCNCGCCNYLRRLDRGESSNNWRAIADSRDYAKRRARVNNELWLNEEPQAFQPLTKGQGWIVIGVIVMTCITLWLLYVASCGADPKGGCWK